MPYVLKKGTKKILGGETFKSMTEAKNTKYQIIIGSRNFKDAQPFLDVKVVKTAKKKK